MLRFICGYNSGIGLHFLHGRYPAAIASSQVRKNTRFSFFIRIPDLQSSRPNIFPGFHPAYFPGTSLSMILPPFKTLYFFIQNLSVIYTNNPLHYTHKFNEG